MKKFSGVFIFVLALSIHVRADAPHINVYFYPHSIGPQDTLLDGPQGKRLDIRGETLLIWVDLFPDMYFTHKTAYILISHRNVRIRRGDWWPVLNGRKVLHNEQGRYALISPFELPRVSAGGAVDQNIVVHVYPHELTSQDRLTDGPLEKLFRLEDNCMLIWVDLLPDAYFAHPTAYILISKNKTRVEHGNWWPTLNGRKILSGRHNKIGILSPFKVLSLPLRDK